MGYPPRKAGGAEFEFNAAKLDMPMNVAGNVVRCKFPLRNCTKMWQTLAFAPDAGEGATW
ncbi:hypothetical protein [Mesorhizobium sp. SARCC-RB16n]|uniref:hypothetical protein n=1 Tax=Mesorhizobium sp. SARCC-RB16n TaxID=2116687 RepID=UPI00122F095C|nr:hypothetical protein [Mesorhizobium sp. SARCC-RB16n]